MAEARTNIMFLKRRNSHLCRKRVVNDNEPTLMGKAITHKHLNTQYLNVALTIQKKSTIFWNGTDHLSICLYVTHVTCE